MRRVLSMDGTTQLHLGPGFLVAVLSVVALECCWPTCISGTMIAALNLYLLAVLVVAANRAAGSPPPWMNDVFPARTWSLAQVAFLAIIAVFGFANMYRQGGAVLNNGYPSGKLDAIYFSMVTLTTLGYGDILPTHEGRLLVIWQLGTGVLLLIGIFPFVIARISNFEIH
jgi:hypothetical protein